MFQMSCLSCLTCWQMERFFYSTNEPHAHFSNSTDADLLFIQVFLNVTGFTDLLSFPWKTVLKTSRLKMSKLKEEGRHPLVSGGMAHVQVT